MYILAGVRGTQRSTVGFRIRRLIIVHIFFFFFFNNPATTEISPLSLPAALPIFNRLELGPQFADHVAGDVGIRVEPGDRKSTRLNSSHSQISYAVFCLKKKNNEALQILIFADEARTNRGA